ncbi:MAG: adaptor protein MecA, partial [Oscillospiraceae bacterium]|nr:adaptor protein MecA [Oscillospiraceae bacterium]
MRLELIRQNKLKITLAKEELSSYGINPEAISKNSDEAQAMFFSVLRKAEEEVGFVYSNSRLVVEAMPSSGGLVIYVTKVDNEAEQKLFDHISARQNQGLNMNVRRKTDEQSGRTSFMA